METGTSSEVKIRPLAWETIQAKREAIALIEKGVETSGHHYFTTGEYLEKLREGALTLWARLQGGAVTDIILTEVREVEGDKFFQVPLCAGTSMEGLFRILEEAEKAYFEIGMADRVEILARLGFCKELERRGYREKARVMGKRIS